MSSRWKTRVEKSKEPYSMSKKIDLWYFERTQNKIPQSSSSMANVHKINFFALLLCFAYE